jgi:hypothetical protein
MKIRVAFLSLLAVTASVAASAQVEHDDMYFNSKDRVKVQSSKPMTLSTNTTGRNSIATEQAIATAINPTDSYSARNVNPEYISQSKMSSGTTESAPYFIPDYAPTAVNQNLKSNNSYNSNYNNLYYPNNAGMYSGFGSPYSSFCPSMCGGYGYSPYGYNNFYNSGWSSMVSISFGLGMGGYPYGGYYPYGGSSWTMGMMGMYGSPNYGWNPYYSMGMGYGYYPGTVVVINDNNRNNVIYGKRATRSSDVNNTVTYNNNRNPVMVTDSHGQVRSSGANGRVSGDGTTSYYQRGWRSNPETNSAIRSDWSSSGRTSGNSSFSDGDFRSFGSRPGNSDFSGGGSRSSNWGAGSSSNFSSGGGSRSSGVSSGSSSSSGVKRGRD